MPKYYVSKHIPTNDRLNLLLCMDGHTMLIIMRITWILFDYDETVWQAMYPFGIMLNESRVR